MAVICAGNIIEKHGYVIPNKFSGFGSMTVRNTNVVTMSSFVVMIQCMFHEKTIGRKQEHDHFCNYEKNFKHWIVKISFIFNIIIKGFQ